MPEMSGRAGRGHEEACRRARAGGVTRACLPPAALHGHLRGPVRASLLLFTLLLSASLLPMHPVGAAEKRDKRKEDRLPTPPPQPVQQEVTVKRGETLDIRLSIYGRKNETLKYLIRS